ncbi:hypothetical protein [Sphingomonas sp.]|jgi:hypothetical protein|uniref:hypothetical protein n=1 Tax=Sphingomonas sp. TaxID=28214 RepID=UPI002D80D9E6|nr:hypothetical protein [Sphingomonas sp.]HEU0043138.1 hypothetical protein [Sphingomonas sp.]
MTMDATRRTVLLAPLLAVTQASPAADMDAAADIVLDDRVALRAVVPRPGLRARTRQENALFVFRPGDARALVAVDTVEGLVVRSAHVPPAQGVWRRVFDGPAEVGWFTREGERDATAAIVAMAGLMQLGAIRQLRWDRTLRYTDTAASRPGAVTLIDVPGVSIDMTGGALAMDNLRVDGTGSGSGFWFGGSCHDCTLRNPTIAWTRRPRRRSRGDGITCKSRPGSAWASRGFRIEGTATIRDAPQAGIIIMGCDRPHVAAAAIERTLADGLHFNACRAPAFGTVRHLDVERWEGDDVGDDAVALVTYAGEASDPAADWKTSTTPWARPELDEWSNTGATGGRVESVHGRANGLRIAGASGVTIDAVSATGKAGAAVVIDSAEEIGRDAAWQYRASRDVRIGAVDAGDCLCAVQVISRHAASDAYRRFGVTVGQVRCSDAATHSVAIERAAGVTLGTVTSERSRHQALFVDTAAAVVIEALRVAGSADHAIILQGKQEGIRIDAVEAADRDILLNASTGSASDVVLGTVTCRSFQAVGPINGLSINTLRCAGGTARFQADPSREGGTSRIRRVRLGTLAVLRPILPAVVFADVESLAIASLTVGELPGAGTAPADRRVVVLDRIVDANVHYTLAEDRPALTALALGGGVGSYVSRRVRVALTSPGEPRLLVQEGVSAPREVQISRVRQ